MPRPVVKASSLVTINVAFHYVRNVMVLLSALTGRMKLDVGLGKPRIVQRKCLAAMEDASKVI